MAADNSRRRLGVVAVALLGIIAMGVAAVAILRPASEQRTVRVGLYQNAPKIYSGPDGSPQGLFPEVLSAIAKERELEPGLGVVRLRRMPRSGVAGRTGSHARRGLYGGA